MCAFNFPSLKEQANACMPLCRLLFTEPLAFEPTQHQTPTSKETLKTYRSSHTLRQQRRRPKLCLIPVQTSPIISFVNPYTLSLSDIPSHISIPVPLNKHAAAGNLVTLNEQILETVDVPPNHHIFKLGIPDSSSTSEVHSGVNSSCPSEI
jgi:hypothetical protein